MALFNFGKKKGNNACCSNENCDAESIEKAKEAMNKEGTVKILGSGCAKCNELEKNVKAALEQLGMDTSVEHVTDFTKIAAYGVMSTPALVVEGKVVSYGKVLKIEEAVQLFQQIR